MPADASQPNSIGDTERTTRRRTTNRDWWPNQLDLGLLRQPDPRANPLGSAFNYRQAFSALDVEALKRDLLELMQTPQDWWPPDYGHYGPLFIRMAWHAAGTYRIHDGRGGGGTGAQRFAPLNSWPDNANLDKARRLLWPIKQKYGQRISWADLIIFAGNCAYEAMGLKTLGFGFGREDIWEPDETDWGRERTWLGDDRYEEPGVFDKPFGSVQMGLIYVNPEGPRGNPDPLEAAKDIRETFRRMGMNDEETVALIVGGHTFGKCHGAAPAAHVGPEPEAAPLEEQGLGWRNSFGTGKGPDTYTSGLEGAWTRTPTQWDNEYLKNLFEYEWELTSSPAGGKQWVPTDPARHQCVPDAHDPTRRNPPMMLTTDLALRFDPIYGPIAHRFYEHQEELEEAFRKAWFKLLHRDMGPVSRYLGPWVPKPQLWQDPVPPIDHDLVTENHIEELKRRILASEFSITQLVYTAWSAASTFRCTDKRGGANGARIRLEPQRSWEVNHPRELPTILDTLERVRHEFHASAPSRTRISLADMIVLGGCAAIEEAARLGGFAVRVPFAPGRTDATQEQTDVESFAALEPRADGFRNYLRDGEALPAEHLLVDRASLLGLSAPEMTVLVGGMRVLGATFAGRREGVLTRRPGVLSNDFFVTLLDMGIVWCRSEAGPGLYVGRERRTGKAKWTATAVDLVFGSNAQLRAISEVYASRDGAEQFVADFVHAWDKVMNLDRFDLSLQP
jgi:catalase-peroxidase